MYAIFDIKNKQHKVSVGELLCVNLLNETPGKDVTFDKVLLLAKDETITVGQPNINNAKVVCEVVRHLRGEKKVAYKFRRRKNSQMKKGHRQELTELKVKDIIS